MARLLSDSDRKPKPKRVVVSKADVTVALGDGDELSDDYIITVRQEHELVRVLLQSPETLLFGRIRPTMLEARDYHYIWVAMENLAQRTGAIAYDRAAVAAEMERIEPQAFRGKYVERLLADIEMEGPVCPDYYVEKVLIHEKVVRHNLKHFRQLTQKLNDKAEVDGGVLVYDEYITAAGDIARTPGVGMPIESVGRRLRHWDPDAAAAKIIPSGHAVIDQVSGGGPSKGDLVVIGGGTNAGKSYMGEELLRSHKDMDSKFLVISVEDDEDSHVLPPHGPRDPQLEAPAAARLVSEEAQRGDRLRRLHPRVWAKKARARRAHARPPRPKGQSLGDHRGDAPLRLRGRHQGRDGRLPPGCPARLRDQRLPQHHPGDREEGHATEERGRGARDPHLPDESALARGV